MCLLISGQDKSGGEVFYVNEFGVKQNMPPTPNCQALKCMDGIDVSCFMLKGMWGFYDKDGNIIVDAMFEDDTFDFLLETYSEEIIAVRFKKDFGDHKAGRYAYLNLEDARERIIRLSDDYTKVTMFENGEAKAEITKYHPDGTLFFSDHYVIDKNFWILSAVDSEGNEILQYSVERDYDAMRDNPPEDAFDGDVDAYNEWRNR